MAWLQLVITWTKHCGGTYRQYFSVDTWEKGVVRDGQVPTRTRARAVAFPPVRDLRSTDRLSFTAAV